MMIALGASVLHPGVANADETPAAAFSQPDAGLTASEVETLAETPPAPNPAAEVPLVESAGPIAPAAPVEPVAEVPPTTATSDADSAAPVAEPVAQAPERVADEIQAPTREPAAGPVAKPTAPVIRRPRTAKLVAISGNGVNASVIAAGETSTFQSGVNAPIVGRATVSLFGNDTCTGEILDTEDFEGGGRTVTGSAVLTTPGTYYWQVITTALDFATLDFVTDSSACGAPGSVVTVLAPSVPNVTQDPKDLLVQAGETASFQVRYTGAPAPAVSWEAKDGASWVPFDGVTTVTTGNIADGFVSTLTLPAGLDQDGLQLRAALEYVDGELTSTVHSAPATLQVVAELEITTTSLPAATLGEPYEAHLEAAGGLEDYTWGEAPGTTLPAGLSLDANGLISGTPTETGTFQVEVQLTDPILPRPSTFLRRAKLSLAPGVPTISSTLTLTVLPAAPAGTPASAPRNVTATQTGPGEVTITWSAPASDGGSPITGYAVGYGNGGSGNGDLFGPTVRQAVFDGLSAGDYQASVTAITTAGDGARAFAPFSIVAAGAGGDVVDDIGVGNALPMTGSDSADQLTLALWLTLGGVAVTAGSRRRRSSGTARLA